MNLTAEPENPFSLTRPGQRVDFGLKGRWGSDSENSNLLGLTGGHDLFPIEGDFPDDGGLYPGSRRANLGVSVDQQKGKRLAANAANLTETLKNCRTTDDCEKLIDTFESQAKALENAAAQMKQRGNTEAADEYRVMAIQSKAMSQAAQAKVQSLDEPVDYMRNNSSTVRTGTSQYVMRLPELNGYQWRDSSGAGLNYISPAAITPWSSPLIQDDPGTIAYQERVNAQQIKTLVIGAFSLAQGAVLGFAFNTAVRSSESFLFNQGPRAPVRFADAMYPESTIQSEALWAPRAYKIEQEREALSNLGIQNHLSLRDGGIVQLAQEFRFNDHIFEGELNKNGKVVGFHYEPGATRSKIIPGTKTSANSLGVYEGSIQIETSPGIWTTKAANGGKSTFFPDYWSRTDVIFESIQAFRARQYLNPSKPSAWSGTTPSGVRVQGYDSPNLTIYPRK